MAIFSFGNKETERFYQSGKIEGGVGWQNLSEVARRKLDIIRYATVIADLRSPPGNRLERLSGDLEGFYSIRINRQWRVIFKWGELGAEEVKIVDYH